MASLQKPNYTAFLSHAHADKSAVDRLHSWLKEKAGIPVWYDGLNLPAGAIPKCRYAAVRLECFFVDGCVDISSPSSSAFNSARHAGGSQRHSVFRSLAIASRV